VGVCYFGVRSTRGAGGGAPPHAPAAFMPSGRAAVVPFVVSFWSLPVCGGCLFPVGELIGDRERFRIGEASRRNID